MQEGCMFLPRDKISGEKKKRYKYCYEGLGSYTEWSHLVSERGLYQQWQTFSWVVFFLVLFICWGGWGRFSVSQDRNHMLPMVGLSINWSQFTVISTNPQDLLSHMPALYLGTTTCNNWDLSKDSVLISDWQWRQEMKPDSSKWQDNRQWAQMEIQHIPCRRKNKKKPTFFFFTVGVIKHWKRLPRKVGGGISVLGETRKPS